MEGKLILGGRETIKEILNISMPLLRAGGALNKIVLSPLPRYIVSPCCADANHTTNLADKNYGTVMGEQLADIHGWLKELLYGKRIKNHKCVCPSSLLGFDEGISAGELAAIWGRNPVHMTQIGYDKEARELIKVIETCNSWKRNCPAQTGSADSSMDSGRGGRRSGSMARPVKDESQSRGLWISASDAVASRSYSGSRRDADVYSRRGKPGGQYVRGGNRDGGRWETRGGGHRHGRSGRPY